MVCDNMIDIADPNFDPYALFEEYKHHLKFPTKPFRTIYTVDLADWLMAGQLPETLSGWEAHQSYQDALDLLNMWKMAGLIRETGYRDYHVF